jgi:hypothetical protein
LLASLGEEAEAMRLFDAAQGVIERSGAQTFAAALDVHRGQLDLARGKRREAEARIDTVRRVGAADAAALVECSDDVRFAVRMLEAQLAARAPRVEGAPSLVVGAGARSFRLGDSAQIDLARRGAVRLVLLALAEARVSSPGVALDRDALLACGWPGERVLQEAGSTRVRVAIATLRRLGLARILVTRDDGYLLHPSVPVTFG